MSLKVDQLSLIVYRWEIENNDFAGKSAPPIQLFNKALAIQAPMVESRIAKLRANKPDGTPGEIVRRLNSEFRAVTVTTGAGVGAAAAVPAIGTGAAVAISGAEFFTFLEASILYVLARSEISGISTDDVERRRLLIMAILLGNGGEKSIAKVAGRTAPHWGGQVVKKIPMETVRAINKVLGRNFVTKYGTRQGIVVLGKLIPLGIGAVIGGTANGLLSQGVISASNRAFGPPPNTWLNPNELRQ